MNENDIFYFPRRHNRVTLRIILQWYAAVAASSAFSFIVFCAGYRIVTGEAVSDFFPFLAVMVPLYVIVIAIIWVRKIQPLLNAERERAWAEFEELVYRQRGF